MKTTTLYDGSVKVDFDEWKHIYKIKGQAVPSVSAITRVINKPALMYWPLKMATEFLEKELVVGGVLNEVDKLNLIEGAKSAHRKNGQNSQAIGTLTHAWVEAYIKGEKPKMPTHEGVRKAVEQFIGFVDKNKVTFLLSEEVVYSKKFHYAGRFDFTCKLGRKLFLGDLKTGKGLWEESYISTSAYAMARQEEHKEEAYQGILLLNCRPDGTLEYGLRDVQETKECYGAFLNARGLYEYLKNHGNNDE